MASAGSGSEAAAAAGGISGKADAGAESSSCPWVLLQTSNDSHAHRLYTTLAPSENQDLYAHCLRGRLHCEVR